MCVKFKKSVGKDVEINKQIFKSNYEIIKKYLKKNYYLILIYQLI